MKTQIISSTLVCLCLFFSFHTRAQFSAAQGMIQLKRGDVSKLGSVKAVNVVFNYDSMKVGKFATEAEYLASKKTELADDAKYQKLETKWKESRETHYEKKFMDAMNNILSKKYFKTVKGDASSAITLHVITLQANPGFASPGGNSTSLDARCVFMEGMDKVVAVYSLEQISTTSQESFDQSVRLGGAYFRAGLLLAKDIKSKLGDN